MYADKIILIFHSRTLTYQPFLYLFDVKFCKKAFTKQVMILAIQTSCDLTPIILGAHFVYGQNDNLTIFERKHVQRKRASSNFYILLYYLCWALHILKTLYAYLRFPNTPVNDEASKRKSFAPYRRMLSTCG